MARTLYLEFRREGGSLAANGSDIMFFADGRWSEETLTDRIQERVLELRSARDSYKNQEFVGYTVSGDLNRRLVQMPDFAPPAWSASV